MLIVKFLNLSNFISKTFIYVILIIIMYHIVYFFSRDRVSVKKYKILPKLDKILITDLNYIPLVNIIIPAWKEGDIFKGCLERILEIKYPKLKVIVNAGGDNKTKKIAEEYKKYENFSILEQKRGEGKVKAIFDCVDYVDVDSDIYLDNDIFLKIIYFLVNKDQAAIISNLTPHPLIRNKDLVKYVLINRNPLFGRIINHFEITGPHTAIKYEILRNSKFQNQTKMKDDGRVFGGIIKEKGFKIYGMINEYVECFNYPTSISKYFNQNLRWIENSFYRKREEKNKIVLIKLLLILLISFYMVIFFFLLFFDFIYLYFGLAILLYFYLQKLRKLIFFKKIDENSDKINFGLWFYIKIIFFIYIDILMNINMFLEIVFFKKKYKKRKKFALELMLINNYYLIKTH